jgi:AsmA protein
MWSTNGLAGNLPLTFVPVNAPEIAGSRIPLSQTGKTASLSLRYIIAVLSSPLCNGGSPIPPALEVVMKKALKIVLIVVGVLIVLVLVVPFLIPVNQFRPTIEEKASAALGRKVELGNLSLSLISGSLSADNISIGDDPKFSSSPFLTAKSLNVGVEILPLVLSKTLNVTGVTIDAPQVTLLHNSAGLWNYSSLGGATAKNKAAKSSGASSSAADLTIKKLDLKNGIIIIGSANSQKRSTYDHVDVTASNVAMTSQFPVTVTADLPSGGKFKLDGVVGPIDEADTALTPLTAKLNVSSLNLASTGFLDPSMGLGGIVDLDGTLESKGGEAETKGNVKFSKALLIAGGAPASVPVVVDFNTKYNLRKNAGVLNPSTLKIGSAAAHLNGTYESAGEATVVNIKLEGRDMPAKDLEAFLPALGIHLPKGASLAAGTLNTDLNVTGPTNRLVTNGTVGLFKAKIANFDLGSKMSTISMLTGLKTGQDLDIEKLTTNLRMAPDGLQAENFLAVVPALGNLIGAGTVNSKNDLDFKMAATLANTATFSSSGGAPVSGIGGVLGAIGGGKGNCKGATIPFLIHGTTADPKFVPDVGGIAASLVKSQLGCAGGATSGATKALGQEQNPADAINALGGLFKKKKPQQ